MSFRKGNLWTLSAAAVLFSGCYFWTDPPLPADDTTDTSAGSETEDNGTEHSSDQTDSESPTTDSTTGPSTDDDDTGSETETLDTVSESAGTGTESEAGSESEDTQGSVTDSETVDTGTQDSDTESVTAGTVTETGDTEGTGSETETLDTDTGTEDTETSDTDSGEPECASGVCCDLTTNTFKTVSVACDSAMEYRCEGSGCGGDAQQRIATQYCSGISAECNGEVVEEDWAIAEDCAEDELCETDSATYSTCSGCANGCREGACCACSAGDCCDGCNYRPSSYACDSSFEYRCEGSGCGADAQHITVTQYCRGSSALCDGNTKEDVVTTNCASDELCETDGTTYSACNQCAKGCQDGTCCACSAGDCCDGCNYRPSSYACHSTTEYRCDGSGCGADAQKRTVSRYCSGSSETCNGDIGEQAWTIVENCTSADLCETDSASYATCSPCTNGCQDGVCCVCSAGSCCDGCNYRPSSYACDSATGYRCDTTGCGGNAQQGTVTQYCSGTSSNCDGSTEDDWATLESCGDYQTCIAYSSWAECGNDVETFGRECIDSGNWYDPSSGLCWQNPPTTDKMTWSDAVSFCENGTWDGYTNWVLPDIDELISLMRGCLDGEATGDFSLSSCGITDPGCLETICEEGQHCDYCKSFDGPGSGGCYWDPDLSGSCMSPYWSSSVNASYTQYAWGVHFVQGGGHYWDKSSTGSPRCVRRDS